MICEKCGWAGDLARQHRERGDIEAAEDAIRLHLNCPDWDPDPSKRNRGRCDCQHRVGTVAGGVERVAR